MPKEIVHWTIAELARQNLPDESILKKELNNHYYEYLIGSIAFDIPYYDFSKSMTLVATSLHGKDKPYAGTKYAEIENYYANNYPDGLLAFIAGTICHALTDINFHPFVNYYTDNDISAHRQLETNLDLFYLGKVNFKTYSLLEMLKLINIKKEDFYKFLSLFIFGDDKHISKIKLNFFKYGIFQSLIMKKSMYKILSFLKLHNMLTLFYGDFKKQNFPEFESELDYPASDGIKKTTLTQIEDNTLEDIRNYFDILENKGLKFLKFPNLSNPLVI